MAGLNGMKHRAFGTRALVRTETSGREQRFGRWRPQSFDVVLAVVVAVGLAAASPLIW
jgi:hypothetical protein